MATNPANEKSQTSNTGRPTMCRTCGSIVGGGQQQCAVCGASISGSSSSAKPRGGADNETIRFARAVLSRPYKFTIMLLVANIFVFLVMWQTSGMQFSVWTAVPEQVLIAFGAKVNYFIRVEHQWWRFVTPMFLHVNLIHLIVNMYSLWIVGPYVERLYGSAKFVVFWVLTGMAGVFASFLTVRPGMEIGPIARFLFKPLDVPSAGASGALFGLVGVLFVFGIKFRHELPEGFKRAFGTGLLPMIFLNLFIGYVGRGFIDNAAHLGGLLSGALLALVVDYRRPDERSRVAITWRVLQIAAIALVVVSFFKVIQHYHDPVPAGFMTVLAPPVETENPAYLKYALAINNAQEAFVVARSDGNSGNVDKAVKDLEDAPHLDQKSDELKVRLKALLVRAKTSPAAVGSPGSANKSVKLDEVWAEFVAWRKDYKQWLDTNARNFNGLNEIETK